MSHDRMMRNFRALHLCTAIDPQSEADIIMAIEMERQLAKMRTDYALLLIARYVYGYSIEQCGPFCGRSKKWATMHILAATLAFKEAASD